MKGLFTRSSLRFAASTGMTRGIGQRPEDIARPTLDALGRQATDRPGWLAKCLESSFPGQPRRRRGPVPGRVMEGMTKPGSDRAVGRGQGARDA